MGNRESEELKNEYSMNPFSLNPRTAKTNTILFRKNGKAIKGKQQVCGFLWVEERECVAGAGHTRGSGDTRSTSRCGKLINVRFILTTPKLYFWCSNVTCLVFIQLFDPCH